MQTQLPPAIRKVWQARALIDGLIWLVLAAGVFAGHLVWQWPLWLVILPLACAVIHTGTHLVLIPYRYAFWRYQITDTAVYLKSGYIFQKDEAIPISRIQNVTLEAGPLLQGQHLQSVAIQTASTKHEIAGVTEATAATLREQIMQLAKEARDDA